MKFLVFVGILALSTIAVAGQKEIETIREQHRLPALAAAIVSDQGIVQYVSGVRKWGDPTPAAMADKFHLGSDTKAMTATLLAIFIERGLLRWDTTLAEALPKLAADMHPDFAGVKIELLPAHHAGISDDLLADNGPLGKKLLNPVLDPSLGRMLVARAILAKAPVAKPGDKFIYSNAGYMILGAILEAVSGKSWETLMREEIFEPLAMPSCGFGVQAHLKADPPDQPWPHVWDGASPKPLPPDFLADNPPTYGPAGTVHCSLADWSHFARLHIDGYNGQDTPILKAASFKKLHESYPSHYYTYGGWGRLEQFWAAGPGLAHNGSNTLNLATIVLVPTLKRGFLVATNIAGEPANEAIKVTLRALIEESGL